MFIIIEQIYTGQYNVHIGKIKFTNEDFPKLQEHLGEPVAWAN